MGVPPHHRFYPEPEAPARPPCPGLLLYLLMGRRLRLAPLSRPLAGQTSSLLTSGLSFGIRSEHGGCVQGVAICRAIAKNFASTPSAAGPWRRSVKTPFSDGVLCKPRNVGCVLRPSLRLPILFSTLGGLKTLRRLGRRQRQSWLLRGCAQWVARGRTSSKSQGQYFSMSACISSLSSSMSACSMNRRICSSSSSESLSTSKRGGIILAPSTDG